jgi:beta-1,4-mannosyltransferase
MPRASSDSRDPIFVAYFGAQARNRQFVMDDTCVTPTGGQLAAAMVPLNVILEPCPPNMFSRDWVHGHGRRYSVIHINWPSSFYAAEDEAERRAKCAGFYAAIEAARAAGMRVVWTMNNLFPHERPTPELDLECRRFLCAEADAIIVPCVYARELLSRHFGRDDRVHVIPRGHQVGLYPNTVSRQEARAQMGLPEAAYVYTFFGYIRPYKGIERLIPAFSSVALHDARLLIAGQPFSEDLQRSIATAASRDPRIVFRPERVPNACVQHVFNSSDAVVAPFLEILSSASVITALTFGTPVVCPAMGCIPEIVDAHCAALYPPDAPDGLSRALQAVRRLRPDEVRRAAEARLRERDWPIVAELTRQAYLGTE